MDLFSGTSLDLNELRDLFQGEYCYLVFECRKNGAKENPFKLVNRKLSKFENWVIAKKVHQSKDGDSFILVAKIDPEQADTISNYFFNLIMPKNITLYVYGPSPNTNKKIRKKQSPP